MEEWEIDCGEIWLPEEGGLCEFFIVVDRGTSRLVYVEANQGYNAVTALEAVARLFVLRGMPKPLRFDRDVRLWGAWRRDSYPLLASRMLSVRLIDQIRSHFWNDILELSSMSDSLGMHPRHLLMRLRLRS
jgi:hypothetical protein